VDGKMIEYDNRPTRSEKYKGFLFVTVGNDCWVSDSEDENAERIIIDCEELVDKLLDSVPCYVGGKYLYVDQAEISAELTRDENRTVFRNLVKIKILREEQEFEILL
jgi:hypothetical protein